MDGAQFDLVTRVLALGTSSRRGAFKAVAAGALAAALGRVAPGETEARRRRRKSSVCKGKKAMCEGGFETCGRSPSCACMRSVSGKKVCGELGGVCLRVDECTSSADCGGPGNYCVSFAESCCQEGSPAFKQCVKKCGFA